MQKLFRVCALAVAICAAFAFAEEEGGFFRMGVRLATGFSGLRDKAPIAIDGVDMPLNPDIQLTGGIHTEFNFGALAIVPEAQYTWYRQSSRRIELKKGGVTNVREAEIDIHAIEMPILFRHVMQRGLFFEFGPQVGFACYSTTGVSSVNNGVASRDEFGETEDMNQLTYGPTVGLGVALDVIQIGVRGHLGLREYAYGAGGSPWLAQIGITFNFF